MYKVILADDEGLVLRSLGYIIEKHYGDTCEIHTAKSGRDLLRLAETVKADVALVDIYMPGINGLQAISAMKASSLSCKIIVLSAYDQFAFAREAISLGAKLYLTKPFSSDDIVNALDQVFAQIDQERSRRDQELEIWEKLEQVEPLLEASLIYALLFREAGNNEYREIKDFLGFHEEYGQVLLLEWGDESLADGQLSNARGAGFQVERFYAPMAALIRQSFRTAVGPVMLNRVICYLPKAAAEAEDVVCRNQAMKTLAALREKLTKQFDLACRAAFGPVRPVASIQESLILAEKALKLTDSPMIHADDLPIACSYQDDYPIALENDLFEAIEAGQGSRALQIGGCFFDWMAISYPEDEANVRLKVLEFVLFAEYKAYRAGGMTYRFSSRGDYLDAVTGLGNYARLREWFLMKIDEACRNIGVRKEEQQDGLAAEMKAYIDGHYHEGISLEDLSRNLNISSYYCSKLFKDKTGQGFVEYLTACRVEEARRLLSNPAIPIKDIGSRVGYADPNYFSRIFKKACGQTPSEFREDLNP